MKKYTVNGFRCSGKTTNAIAMAIAFAGCGKKVDYLVHNQVMIKYIKNIIKTKYGISGDPISIYFYREYAPSKDTAVVICDECNYTERRFEDPNLIVIEYTTPEDFEMLLHKNPNIMNIYSQLVAGKLTFHAPDFNKPKEGVEDTGTFMAALISIQESLHCTTDQALAVYNYAKENGI